MLLEAHDLHVSYGRVPAVRGVDLCVADGEAVALLGRNGAGKTSTLRALAGLMPLESGTITYDGAPITGLTAEERVRIGLALVPEGRGVFPGLTVRENLLLGAHHRRLRVSRASTELERAVETFPALTDRMSQKAGSLSGGEQQMLVIARAMMSQPRLLLVDEPSLGLAPVIVERLYELMEQLKSTGMTLIVVEQYVEIALGFADRAYVLDKGRVAVSGPSDQLATSDQIAETYLSQSSEVPS